MIIAKITDGLGNQISQYAAARSLACRRHTSLKLDLAWFEGNKNRRFSLGYFATELQTASPAEVDAVGSFGPSTKARLGRLLDGCKPRCRRRHLQELVFAQDDSILHASAHVVLSGYWFNRKFFEDIRETLLGEFTLRQQYVTDGYLQVLRKISRQPTVALHVRRGDYLLPKNSRLFETLSASYYQEALALMAKHEPEAQVMVLSDDPEWVRQNISLPPGTIFASEEVQCDYLEFSLMSQCTHHIIANSTFSWWAAWLGRAAHKKVVAPSRWYTDAAVQQWANGQRLHPDDWIVL